MLARMSQNREYIEICLKVIFLTFHFALGNRLRPAFYISILSLFGIICTYWASSESKKSGILKTPLYAPGRCSELIGDDGRVDTGEIRGFPREDIGIGTEELDELGVG